MLLKGESIVQYLRNTQEKNVQPVSIDLTIKEIKNINGGHIYKNKPAIIYPYSPVPTVNNTYPLSPGMYSVTFKEDCIIPSDKTGLMLHKSSLVRVGATLDCGIYDPGYKSEGGMGAVLNVVCSQGLQIEKDSCIATFYMVVNERVSVDKLYDGQYQGDKDYK